MSFLTPALLAGAALVALPIVLHLVMRQEPQRLVFPAMRFIQQRRATNQTRMKLQHWLLLALRCAAIGLLALALARPVLRSGGGENAAAGLAAGIVVDGSPRMSYLHDNQTRLEAAQETAAWLISQLPIDAQVAVFGGGGRSRRLVERDAAVTRLERLATSAAAKPLAGSIVNAITAVAENEDARQEVFVFTDLASAAWGEADRRRIAGALEQHGGVRLYLVDVGVPRPINRGLGPIRLSAEAPRTGQAVTIRSAVYATSTAGDAPLTAELWLSTGDAPPEKRGETIIAPGGADADGNAGTDGDTGTDAEALFNLAALDEGVHQGFVRLLGSDPLAVDDTRHFTLAVESARPLLVVAATRDAALFVTEAIAPSAAGAAPRQPIAFRRFDQLAGESLSDHAGMLMLDPPGLADDDWRRVAEYARRGGSVALFLGRGASRQTHNAAAPQSLLPGPLRRRSRAETYFRPAAYTHGSLDQLAEFAELIPWSRFPVFESWDFESLAPDTVVVAPFADSRPALVERLVGEGRVLTLATPVSDSANRDPWNLLPTGDDPWPFVLMMGNLADYLAGVGEQRKNYTAGEPATVTAPPDAAEAGFVLRLPSGDATRRPAPIGTAEIVIGATDLVGNYRLQAGGAAGRLDTGFSVNAPADAGRLERIDFGEIVATLGEERVQLAVTRDELTRDIDRGRIGREFYPYLIVLVAVALAAEQWVANRFYREA